MKVYIVIAAFNEERNVGTVVRNLRKHNYTNIVVVDDCSQDKTSNSARKAGATVLRHVVNRGQGASLRTGIEYALQHGADAVVTFDADGQHRIKDLPAMLKPVINKQVDVTLGSRFLRNPKKIPFVRRMTLRIAIITQNLFYGIRLTDAHNGFRVLSRKAAKKITITCDRMAHASEIAEQIHVHKLKFKEVPVIINYTDETLQHGHGSFGQGIRVLIDMIVKKFTR